MSTFRPVMGPAVTQLLEVSQIWRVPVDALDVSCPAATVVDRLNEAGELELNATLSAAVQAIEWSLPLHVVGAVAQSTVGLVVSELDVVHEDTGEPETVTS